MILQVEEHQAVLTLTLHRPDVNNAFNAELIEQLLTQIQYAHDHETLRAVVLRGAGKHFSAGADLHWMRSMKQRSESDNVDDAQRLGELMYRLAHCRKPVIAVVHGAVMGGGVGLTACADIAIARVDAQFALSETRLGLSPATISPFVVRAIGGRQARRYMLTGERFSAEKALELGLVHDISEDVDALLAHILSNIKAGGPSSHRKIKKLISDVEERPLNETLMENLAWRIALQRVSEEGQEGLSAFIEKRPARWMEEDPS